MLANGFPVEMLVELIRNGLASAVARVRITEAGGESIRSAEFGRALGQTKESHATTTKRN
jgi:hypothetical protein